MYLLVLHLTPLWMFARRFGGVIGPVMDEIHSVFFQSGRKQQFQRASVLR